MGTYSSVSVNGEWGSIKTNSVRACYNEIKVDQAILGIAYVDGSHQSPSHLAFQEKGPYGHMIHVHGNHWPFQVNVLK